MNCADISPFPSTPCSPPPFLSADLSSSLLLTWTRADKKDRRTPPPPFPLFSRSLSSLWLQTSESMSKHSKQRHVYYQNDHTSPPPPPTPLLAPYLSTRPMSNKIHAHQHRERKRRKDRQTYTHSIRQTDRQIEKESARIVFYSSALLKQNKL